MTEITIKQQGEPNDKGKSWGYYVWFHRQKPSERYSVRARTLDNHYLLEEKFGRAHSISFDVFGIEDLTNFQEADKRLNEKVKSYAEEVAQELTPKIVEIKSEEQE